MNTTNEYHTQATGFLEKFGIAFEYIIVGTEVSRIDKEKRNYRYIARFKRSGKAVEFDFHGSIADYEASIDQYKYVRGESGIQFIRGNKLRSILHAYDVLACITKSSPGMFSDFCSEYGYDEDSRKAFETYNAVCEEWKKVSGFFTSPEIDELQEIG